MQQLTRSHQPAVHTGATLDQVRLTGQESTFIPHLALGLGNFEREGLSVELVNDINQPHHYMMQAALDSGEIDASVHWFQHVLYGIANGAPVVGVMVLNDAPELTIMVANRVKSEIRSATDFKGRNIAEGAGYATKSILTNYLASRAGLPVGSYTPVMAESEGRREAVLKGLREGAVDVFAFQEPMTSAIAETGLTSILYSLTTREATVAALGDTFFAQSLFVSPRFIEQHPERVQRLVNAFVRTLRFINSHTPREIVENLPASYFDGKDPAAEERKIANKLGSCARNDYRFTRGGVQLVIDALQSAPFDSSEEGQFRARVKQLGNVDPTTLYTNRFVERAMESIGTAGQ